MGAARLIILSIALVAAVGLAVVIRNMLASDEQPVAIAEAKAPATPMTRVLVAKRDLPVGTAIQPSDLGWQPWPAEGLSAEYFTDGSAPRAAADTAGEKAAEGAQQVAAALTGNAAMENMVGAVVREPIALNDPIVERKIVRGGEGGYLAVVLAPGMRAIGVPVSVESGAGGFILPGDRVDVLQSREVERTGGQGPAIRVTQPVVTNVKVLAIDQKTQPEDESKSLVGNVATLEVDATAAEALVEARQRGEMQLVLRSYADAGAPTGRSGPRGASGQSPSVRVFSQGETVEMTVPR
jgi:pilus assembly protein CpaB